MMRIYGQNKLFLIDGALVISLLWSLAVGCVMALTPGNGVLAAVRASVLTFVGVIVIFAAAIDRAVLRLPHALTLTAAAVAVIGTAVTGSGLQYALGGAAVGAGCIKLLQIITRYMGGSLGSGDAVLMLSLGAMAGPHGALVILFLAFLAVTWVHGFQQGRLLPFGPYLVGVGLPVILLCNTRYEIFVMDLLFQ
jgi:prepilin signal peptidase PulO-like enzyme (type II secretory pathway)